MTATPKNQVHSVEMTAGGEWRVWMTINNPNAARRTARAALVRVMADHYRTTREFPEDARRRISETMGRVVYRGAFPITHPTGGQPAETRHLFAEECD